MLLPVDVGTWVQVPLHDLLDIEGPSAPLLAPPCEATQGGDGLSRKNAIILNHLVDYKGSGKSLKRIKEDHNQFLRGKIPFPDSRRRARLSSIKTYQRLLFH